jgi:hypothetical protein
MFVICDMVCTLVLDEPTNLQLRLKVVQSDDADKYKVLAFKSAVLHWFCVYFH